MPPTSVEASAGTREGNAEHGRPAWYKGHLPVLDGIRGIAVLVVMLYHFVMEDMHSQSGALAAVLTGVAAVGRLGVDLFFVLSGFLITGILVDKKSAPGYFSTFYARRVLRIFPLYYLALVLAFFVLPLAHGEPVTPWSQQGWAWFYGTNIAITFFQTPFPYIFHFWSLAVEEHFYMFWPLVVWLLPRRHVVTSALALSVGAVLTRIWLSSHDQSSYFLTPSRMDALCLGSVLAIAVRSDRACQVLDVLMRPRWMLLFLLVVSLPYVTAKALGNHIATDALRYFVVAVCFTLLLAVAVARPKSSLLSTTLSSRTLTTLGKYSYGLYVYHGMLADGFDVWFPSALLQRFVHFAALAVLLKVVISIACSMAVALVSWTLFENPLLKLKKYFEYREPQHATPLGSVAGLEKPSSV